ncbi:bolA-like protein 2 isoform X2 [Octodon degus]|uniref:BolA-like protein 2 isoform X2 n=1 Tax=Octodon degus TaxID=10160 RepID=A0A6P6EUJ3_OCTDE|nr:bolA-like protein 2 isoform X2 [Octodon degus]
MELSATSLRDKLQRDLEADHVEVEDTTPNRCATSFRVLVVSTKFEGKPLLQRHRPSPLLGAPAGPGHSRIPTRRPGLPAQKQVRSAGAKPRAPGRPPGPGPCYVAQAGTELAILLLHPPK